MPVAAEPDPAEAAEVLHVPEAPVELPPKTADAVQVANFLRTAEGGYWADFADGALKGINGALLNGLSRDDLERYCNGRPGAALHAVLHRKPLLAAAAPFTASEFVGTVGALAARMAACTGSASRARRSIRHRTGGAALSAPQHRGGRHVTVAHWAGAGTLRGIIAAAADSCVCLPNPLDSRS